MTSSNTQAAAYGKRQKEEGSDLLFALKNKQANRSCQMAGECCLEESEQENREQQRGEEEPDKGDRSFRKDEELSTVAIGCSTGKQIQM